MGDENDRSMETELECEEEEREEVVAIVEDEEGGLEEREVAETDEDENEFADEDEDQAYIDELAEIEELEEMTSPSWTCWIDADGQKHQEVVVFIYENLKNKLMMIEPCPICFQPFSTQGHHRISCLPCGHLYGLSCLKKWFLAASRGKCPLCNSLCKYRDAKLLHAPSCASAHQKTSSTRHFPLTKQGLIELKEHERLRFVNAKKMYSQDHELLVEVLMHQKEVSGRGILLEAHLNDLSKREEESEQDYELRRQFLNRRLDAMRTRCSMVGRFADVLEQRIDVSKRWLSAYQPTMKNVIKMYNEHFALQKNDKPCVAAAESTCHKH